MEIEALDGSRETVLPSRGQAWLDQESPSICPSCARGCPACPWSSSLSVAAAVGFIALIGQASLNGVLVVSAIAERHRAGGTLERSIVDGCRERLRPVLMTSLLAALGLVPAALSRSIGSETQRPIAVVIVFGTLSAAFLTLIVLPVMYRAWVRLVGGRDNGDRRKTCERKVRSQKTRIVTTLAVLPRLLQPALLYLAHRRPAPG